ncbi:hypothetical protein BH09BAC3_BH09BAC3_11200 [soil metagenome]
MSITQSLQTIFIRDLNKLEAELLLYPFEELLWNVQPGITNPAGNLCLHLCGNLQYYIGAVLGKSGYLRNRENEFAAKNISRENLLEEIAATKKAIERTLSSIGEKELASEYPQHVLGYPMSTSFFLIHLAAHLGYHLGQVNYHRRLAL